jgi:steroid 5-alpha reductase family enzyme
MDAILQLYEYCAVAILLYVTVGFWLSRRLGKRDDMADVAWGLGFVLIALVSLVSSAQRQSVGFSQVLIAVLVFVWGVRLSWHIGRRFLRSTGDRRYLEARRAWTQHTQLRSYLTFFLLQGLLMLVISLPIVIVDAHAVSLGEYQLVGLMIGLVMWLVGFYFETVGDAQLGKFVRNPSNKAKLMTTGLWRYSRHPNYFGELTQWWGVAVIALGASFGWLGLVGPLVLSLLIIKVSGIPTAEAQLRTRSKWSAYADSTSALIPLPPKTAKTGGGHTKIAKLTGFWPAAHKSFWWRLSALATLSGVLYCSWPLGYVLNPAVARNGLASGFEGVHQPYNWLFIGGDVSSSIVIAIVCWLLWCRLGSAKFATTPKHEHTATRQKRLLAAILLSVVVFAIGTTASALLPEHCEPSLQRCPNFMHDHWLLAHGIGSIAASIFLFVSLALLWWQRRSDMLLSLLVLGYALFGLFSVAALFYTSQGNWSQQYYITLCSLWLALLPYATHKVLVNTGQDLAHASL